NRAWLNPGSPDQSSFVADARILLTIRVANTGRVTARKVLYHAFATVRTHPPLDEFDLADSESNWPRVSIEPGSALNMEIKLGPFTESEIAHMSREPNRLYVYALIELQRWLEGRKAARRLLDSESNLQGMATLP